MLAAKWSATWNTDGGAVTEGAPLGNAVGGAVTEGVPLGNAVGGVIFRKERRFYRRFKTADRRSAPYERTREDYGGFSRFCVLPS